MEKIAKNPFLKSTDVWLYRNILTSQVVISPSRTLLNSRSMAQLPPNRRLHPTALRKDHWTPLLKASFSSSDVMRQVYARLLEYRKWRAQEPVPIERRAMRIKARRRLEINQVATTVADLAASCDTFAKASMGEVKITWMNEEEKVFAQHWPANVRHSSGLDVLRGFQVIEDSSDLLPVSGEAPALPASTTQEKQVV